MKPYSFLSLLLLVIMLAACGPAQPASPRLAVEGDELFRVAQPAAAGQRLPETRAITVSGNAEVKVVPDEVLLTVGVATQDESLAAAKQQNDTVVQRALQIIQRSGIDPKYVQTDYLRIEPQYSYGSNWQTLTGYAVYQSIGITLKDVSLYDGLLSQLLEAGVNHVYDVQFRTTELRKYKDEARRLAIQAAREKATALAQELGQGIGQPLSIQEQSANAGYYTPWGWSSNMTQNVTQMSGGESTLSEGTLALGQISVSASVSVEFELTATP